MYAALRTDSTKEEGNALFLILIAVVLFAALSYAITQSNRSGGNAGRETNSIYAATIMEYTSDIRTGITRMVLRGTAVTELIASQPGSYTVTTTREIFHPDGGGVSYQDTDVNVVSQVIPIGTNPTKNWYFFYSKPVQGIATPAGDGLVLLGYVKTGICEQINQRIHGTTTIPTVTLSSTQMIDLTTPITGPTNVNGQPVGCVSTTDGDNVYYHVVVEQ